MAEPILSIRQLFAISEHSGKDQSPDRWGKLQQRLTREVKGIKWAAETPDLVAKIGDLLEIGIPDVLIAAWKKAAHIQTLLEESRKNPEETLYAGLAEHSIASDHHPYIEIRIKGIPAKKIEFTVHLVFKLEGSILKIRNGLIEEIQMGACEAQGTIEYDGLTLVEKKMERIQLPGSIPTKEFAPPALRQN